MRITLLTLSLSVFFTTTATATDWRKVRIHNDDKNVQNCEFVESVDLGAWLPAVTKAGLIKRLRKKSARLGGDTLVLLGADKSSFLGDWSGYGDVYKCGTS